MEATSLSLGRAKLRPEEYFDFGLFDPSLTKNDRERFAGTRRCAVVNDSVNQLLGAPPRTQDDKLQLSALVRGFGLGGVETQAMIGAKAASPLPMLTSPGEASAFLRKGARYPLFGKPIDASLSIGAASLDGYDPASDRLKHHSGAETTVDTFVEEVFGPMARAATCFRRALLRIPISPGSPARRSARCGSALCTAETGSRSTTRCGGRRRSGPPPTTFGARAI